MVSRIVTEVRRNIVAWLALFVALSGTSLAASHYIITSTKQIKPSALKQLRGARGPAGPSGAGGTNGATGAQGPTGKEGPKGKEGPTGKEGIRGETGPEGKPGPTSPPGKEGKEGKEGPEGKPGTALAYAHVTAAGKVEPIGESMGFTGVTIENPPGEKGEGVYCISGVSGELHNVVVTIDNKESEEPFWATATIGESSYVKAKKPCSSTPQITVETGSFSAAKKEPVTSDAPFFIDIN
jgi:Collagen triple helix repeat (20 copies)